MSQADWALPAPLVDVAFPFHLVLDRGLRIVDAGSSLQHLHQPTAHQPTAHQPTAHQCTADERGLIGRELPELFDLATPQVPVDFDAFARQSGALFLLRSRVTPDLVLRGQMLFDAAADRLVFIGSPWVTEMSTFVALGLTIDDFAMSDAVVDYALLLQNQSMSSTEADALTEQLRISAARLAHQAFHDALTGLPNRSRLVERLQAAIEERASRQASGSHGRDELAVLMLDLDGFKAVNDSFGHSAGDAVLEVIGKRLRHVARQEDVVARFGGDEFALLVDASRPAGSSERFSIDAVADRVLAAIGEPVALPENWGVTVPLSGSIGIARATGTEDAEELLRNADLAMYAAKARGKARHVTFTPAMHAASIERMDLAHQLRHALERGELQLLYQPVLRLHSNRFAGAEALLRWQHPTRGLLTPESFVDIAEESGLIVSIGAWALDTACAELRRWQGAHSGPEPLGVAVNLSGRQFGPGIVSTVAGAIRRHGIDPSTLTLEITEGLITEDSRDANATIRALKDLGVWLAIDDFGTGHSSLGRLREYAFDELKIDRQFVSDLDTGDPTLVVAQIAMAHGLGLNVVAEGVETITELEHLRREGCDQVQGYLISRPLPVHAVRAMLAGPAEWRPDQQPTTAAAKPARELVASTG